MILEAVKHEAWAEALNRDCQCTTLDRAELQREIESDLQDAGLYRLITETRPHLFSDTAVFVSCAQVERMGEIIRAVETVVALPAYREAVLAWTPEIAHVDPGPRGVFLGYDFHLGPAGPRLIEINTNAGGALLNAVLARAQRACCRAVPHEGIGLTEFAALDRTFVEMFSREWHQQRGQAPLTRIAIVDDTPAQQYLYPEFVLFERMFRRHGIDAVIAKPQELARRANGLYYADLRIDLVYNRLTDFYLEQPEHRVLREAYESGEVVLTPHPRGHALYADKRNLSRLTDEAQLRALGVESATRSALLDGIPRTRIVSADNAAWLWEQRRRFFFKPARGYGAKAAYRGDKLTKRVWREILAGGYIAQETVPPSERCLGVAGASVALKLDVRNYVYDGKVQLLAARLYQGQTTNFRTPGGGFATVFCPSLEGKSQGTKTITTRAKPSNKTSPFL